MNFLKVEWTKKRGAIALLACGLAVSSFVLGGYVATGNWNPWGNRHYYQILNANFQECHILSGVQTCTSGHNTLFNTGALYVEQVVLKGAASPALCGIGAACSFNFIALAGTSPGAALAATQSSTGLTTATTSGDCGVAGGTGATGQNGAELTTGGLNAQAGAVTDISGNSPATSTVVKTFTASAITTVAQSCLVNQAANASANRVNLAAQTFPAVTLQVNDQITITWQISWTWS
ncbi:MAG TPA: hypothetical protein VFE96_04605 [Candidatus Bathyarchaeia archaeon]|nr:hypothetical protein [Candidatus Bathyarchaeia archaeon]